MSWAADPEFKDWFERGNYPLTNMSAVYGAWKEGRKCPCKEKPTPILPEN